MLLSYFLLYERVRKRKELREKEFKSKTTKKIQKKKNRQKQDLNLRPVSGSRFQVYRLRPLDHPDICWKFWLSEKRREERREENKKNKKEQKRNQKKN